MLEGEVRRQTTVTWSTTQPLNKHMRRCRKITQKRNKKWKWYHRIIEIFHCNGSKSAVENVRTAFRLCIDCACGLPAVADEINHVLVQVLDSAFVVSEWMDKKECEWGNRNTHEFTFEWKWEHKVWADSKCADWTQWQSANRAQEEPRPIPQESDLESAHQSLVTSALGILLKHNNNLS